MSKIEWTGKTWNPVVGCSVLSPGCTNCYAMRLAARLARMGQERYVGLTRQTKAGAVWTGEMREVPSALLAPLRRRKPTTWFVNSMSDLFHESVPDAWIDRVFAVMALATEHTFQVLTKRSARMRAYLADAATEGRVATGAFNLAPVGRTITATNLTWSPHERPTHFFDGRWPLPNVWLGVSAEDQRRADERVPDLLATPAAVRFVSAEPLLGPIDIGATVRSTLFAGTIYPDGKTHPLAWVIVGGESGPGARPMHPDWARQIRDACAAAGVAYFFKQWGAWAHSEQEPMPVPGPSFFDAGGEPTGDGWRFWTEGDRGMNASIRVGKKAAGRLLDGRTHDAMPEAAHG